MQEISIAALAGFRRLDEVFQSLSTEDNLKNRYEAHINTRNAVFRPVNWFTLYAIYNAKASSNRSIPNSTNFFSLDMVYLSFQVKSMDKSFRGDIVGCGGVFS